MISKRTPKLYCCEDISLIENYNEAINSDEPYDCHHKNEIILNKTANELIELGLYYNRPANELIFLSCSEHHRLHQTGKHLEESAKIKISRNSPKFWEGKHLYEETRKKISYSLSGKPMKEETKNKLSVIYKGKHWKLENGKRVWY